VSQSSLAAPRSCFLTWTDSLLLLYWLPPLLLSALLPPQLHSLLHKLTSTNSPTCFSLNAVAHLHCSSVCDVPDKWVPFEKKCVCVYVARQLFYFHVSLWRHAHTHTHAQCVLQNADLATGDEPPPYCPSFCVYGMATKDDCSSQSSAKPQEAIMSCCGQLHSLQQQWITLSW